MFVLKLRCIWYVSLLIIVFMTNVDDSDGLPMSDCSYYTGESFTNNLSISSDNSFSVLHHNIRSFGRNFDELSVFLDGINYQFHVLVLTETWFSTDTVAAIEGYCAYHSFRTGRTGGGVSVYVSDKLVSRQLSDVIFGGDAYEICAVDVCCNGESICIIGTYRPPCDADFEHHLNNFVDILVDFNIQNKKVFICGDFNVDTLIDNTKSRLFSDAMQSLFLLPVISIPTRVTDDSGSLIDNIWTNQLSVTISGVFVVDITDHFPIFTVIQRVAEQNRYLLKYFRDHSATSLARLDTTVEEFVNNYVFVGEINGEMSNLLSNLMSIYNDCCAIRSKNYSIKSLTKPWINREVRRLIDRKHCLFRQYRSGFCSFQFYNSFKNKVCSHIRNAKRLYFKKKFTDCSKSGSDMWRLLRKVLNREKRSASITLEVDGSSVADDFGVATAFNSYFSCAAERIVRDIPNGSVDPLSYMMGLESDQSFFAAPATPSDVYAVVCSLKLKGAPLSDIPTFIYKRLNRHLCPLISDLFNKSLSTGIFPDVLKYARVVPIHKGGDVKNVGNYRPISTLSVMSKIFEHLMSSRIKQYIEHFSILGHCQFGFRKKFLRLMRFLSS